MKKKPVKIVLVGNAFSGKTRVLEGLQRRIIPGNRWKPEFVGEAASDVMRETPLHPNKDPLAFQYAVSLTQILREAHAEQQADTEENLLLICDRGVADAYVYLDDDAASQVLDNEPLECCLSRYDLALLFDTYYNSTCESSGVDLKTGNAFRYETEEQMAERSLRTVEVWGRHENLITVPVFPTIDDKIVYVAHVINAFLSERVFAE